MTLGRPGVFRGRFLAWADCQGQPLVYEATDMSLVLRIAI